MLATLIPFFLVARLAIDETAWKHGPEYVFNVEINSTIVSANNKIPESNYTQLNLFCRPKMTDRLNCYLANETKLYSDGSQSDENADVSTEPFEIQFDNRGVDYLIVDEDVCVNTLNWIRAIVGLLTIGVDLNGKPDGIFYTAENSVIGECNVTFAINHFPSKGTMRSMRPPRYELESLPQLNKVPGEAIVIQKTTNLNNCSYYAESSFASYGGNNGVEKELDLHLRSSAGRIFVSDTRFVSSVTRTGSKGSRDPNNHSDVTEYISLSLQDIRPAEKKLPEVPRASKTNVSYDSDLNKIPFAK